MKIMIEDCFGLLLAIYIFVSNIAAH